MNKNLVYIFSTVPLLPIMLIGYLVGCLWFAFYNGFLWAESVACQEIK